MSKVYDLRKPLPARDNNFQLIRFIAASMVLFTHSFEVIGFATYKSLREKRGRQASIEGFANEKIVCEFVFDSMSYL